MNDANEPFVQLPPDSWSRTVLVPRRMCLAERPSGTDYPNRMGRGAGIWLGVRSTTIRTASVQALDTIRNPQGQDVTAVLHGTFLLIEAYTTQSSGLPARVVES